MNILFIANLVPYPLDNGGKILTYSTLQSLSKYNTIDLVCFYEKENIKKAGEQLKIYCREMIMIPVKVTTQENYYFMMKKALKSIFSKLPLGIMKYQSLEMEKSINVLTMKYRYDYVFFNILAMYVYSNLIREKNPFIKFVLYEQNCETLIYKRYMKQSKNFLKKLFLLLESYKLSLFERNAVERVDKLIVLSKADKKELEKNVKHSLNCEIIPIGVENVEKQKEYIKKDNAKLSLLFVGTLTWAPNNEGVLWFLKNIMNDLQDEKKYELYIVGKNPSDSVKKLSTQYKNVYVTGYVDSVEEYYEKCDVLIVPLFIGSGQRVKIIEGFAKGIAVLSTSIGAEGLEYEDGKNILIANDKEEFIFQINRCFNRKNVAFIGANGKLLFDKKYSVEAVSQKFYKLLQ